MKNIIVILLLLPISGVAQSIEISPSSMKLWGQIPSVAKVAAEYKDFEAIWLIPYRHYEFVMPATGEHKGSSNDFNIGLFYKPVSVSKGDFSASGGVGAFFQRFPTGKGSIVNFTLEVEYRINKSFSVQYQHLSNGFGIQNDFNPGLDNLSIVINF